MKGGLLISFVRGQVYLNKKIGVLLNNRRKLKIIDVISKYDWPFLVRRFLGMLRNHQFKEN